MNRLLSSFFTCIFSLAAFFCFSSSVQAQEEFKTEYNTVYTVDKQGDAKVSQEITLTNNFSTVYATSYSLSLEGKKPINVKAVENGAVIPTAVQQENQTTKIEVSFPDAMVGKGKVRVFTVSYTISHLAMQNGQVWDVTIPRIASVENVDSYTLTLFVPSSLGKLAYISPKPKSEEYTPIGQTFIFAKEDLIKAGVVAAFGDFQVFSFDLSYHIQNPYSDKSGKTDIALVPDTVHQRLYYTIIDPKPESVQLDEDGNWLATYFLKPGEKKDIHVAGNVQIFSFPQSYYSNQSPKNRSEYLSASSYWQTQDPDIIRIAQELGTPRAIYDYVVKTLSYNYDRVSQDVQRLGAKQALTNPTNAICMEFTDLFITLSRAAGIPAREVNGYAYTENPQVQPLSLVADVLHAWPEYWDETAQRWKAVDPTWGNTTGGVDYFGKFDLSHITFAIHGKSDDYPAAAGSYKLAGSSQRDVSVSFGALPDNRETVPSVQIVQVHSFLPFFPNKIHVTVSNPGPVALYNRPIAITSSGVALKTLGPDTIEFLAPFASQEFDLSYTFPLISKSKSSKIQVLVGDYTSTYEISQASVQLLQALEIFLLLAAIVVGGLAIIYAIRNASKPKRKSH